MFSKNSIKVNHPVSHVLHVVLLIRLPSIEPRVLSAAMQLLSFDKTINKASTLSATKLLCSGAESSTCSDNSKNLE